MRPVILNTRLSVFSIANRDMSYEDFLCEYTNLTEIIMMNAHYRDRTLPWQLLEYCKIINFTFENCTFTNLSLYDARLRSCMFKNCKFVGRCRWPYAELYNCVFEDCTFERDGSEASLYHECDFINSRYRAAHTSRIVRTTGLIIPRVEANLELL